MGTNKPQASAGPVVKLAMIDLRFPMAAALLAREKADPMYARQIGMVLEARGRDVDIHR